MTSVPRMRACTVEVSACNDTLTSCASAPSRSPNETICRMPAVCAASRSRANCAMSALITAAPPGSTPEKISAFASAMASSVPKNSRCTGAIVVTIATCGRTSCVSGVISPAWFMPISNTPSRGARHQRKRQRHAPVIVVGGGRRMRLALPAEHQPQRLLGSGLADRAGDRDDLARTSGRAMPWRGRSAPRARPPRGAAAHPAAARPCLPSATTARPAPALQRGLERNHARRGFRPGSRRKPRPA